MHELQYNEQSELLKVISGVGENCILATLGPAILMED